MIDNSDWLPPAIHFLVKYPDKASQIKEFFTNLERLAAGLMILRTDINQRGRRYAEVLKAIEKSADDAIITTKQLLSPEEQNQIIEILDGNLYQQRRSRLYVLKRLNSAITEEGLKPNDYPKLVTIEHVLPQNPKADSEWYKNWEDEEREKWAHRLGNLVLLSRKTNSEAQNYDFKIKKEKYFQKGNPTKFSLTIEVINQDEWNQPIVEHNQQEYLEKLTSLWDLKQSIISTPSIKPRTTTEIQSNSQDFYVNFGEGDRSWEDWQKYGFIAGGGGKWYSQTLKNLSVGDRFFVNYCGNGYVAVGIVEENVVPVKDFQVEINSKKIPIREAPIKSKNIDHDISDLDLCEHLVKVKWLKAFPKNEAYWEKGMFAIQHTCCRLRHIETIEKLYKHFGISENI